MCSNNYQDLYILQLVCKKPMGMEQEEEKDILRSIQHQMRKEASFQLN